MEFVKRKKMLITVKANMDPALRAQIGEFVPEPERNFFYIASHLEPLSLYTHFYHWWDLAQMRDEPHTSPIRRGALLYNIWDEPRRGHGDGVRRDDDARGAVRRQSARTRSPLDHAGAARGARPRLAVCAGERVHDEGGADFHVKWTPRGWMSPTLDLLGFEQHMYMRQPGYGTSYITGKFLLEQPARRRVPGSSATTSR